MSGITRSEWLAALGEAEIPNDPTALTMLEICDLLDIKETAAKDRMRRLLKEGKATRAYKHVVNSTGNRVRVAAYKLVAAAKRKK